MHMAAHTIYALKYAGPLTSSGALIMWLREWERTVERNYYIWCLRGEQGPMVIDAGASPALAKERKLAGYASPAEVLSRIGIQADEVGHVILTHLHWDHADGVALFPNATIYIQEEEYCFWVKDPLSKRAPLQFFVVDSYLEYLASLEGTDRLALFKGDQEILPGIECLSWPPGTMWPFRPLQSIRPRERRFWVLVPPTPSATIRSIGPAHSSRI